MVTGYENQMMDESMKKAEYEFLKKQAYDKGYLQAIEDAIDAIRDASGINAEYHVDAVCLFKRSN